mgnify:CR=1 FL=1
MKCPILDLETDNLEINIINTIGAKKMSFFTTRFEKMSTIDTESSEYQLFKKYFDIYIHSNLWEQDDIEIYLEIIKYIKEESDITSLSLFSFTKEINFINKFLDTKNNGIFWGNIIHTLLYIDSYSDAYDERDEKFSPSFFKSIKKHLKELNFSLILKIIHINKKEIVKSPLWTSTDTSILYKIISSNILFISIKVDIFLVFLKDKTLRDDMLSFMNKLVIESKKIKETIIGSSIEDIEQYDIKIKQLNKDSKFYYKCLSVFCFLLERGIKSEDSLEKIHFNYIKSFKCPFNFCDITSLEDTQKYNFMTRLFFMIHKLIDNIYITSYNEIDQRDSIINEYKNEIDYIIENNRNVMGLDILNSFNKIEIGRVKYIKKHIIMNDINVRKFFKLTCKWSLMNSVNIKVGELDSILNTLMVYYSKEKNVIYHKELFDLLTFLMGEKTITKNNMLQIKCVEIIYSFIIQETSTGDLHMSLYFENIIEEFNDKLIWLFIKSKRTLEEFDSYYSSLLMYKFIYIFNNLNIYETIELKDTKQTKKFIKLILENAISNIDNLELTLDIYDKHKHLPEEEQDTTEINRIETKISNLNIFINSNNITILFLIKSFQNLFIDEDIINTYSIFLSNTLSKFIKITDSVINMSSVVATSVEQSKFDPIIINFEKIIRYHNNNEKLLSLMLENTNSKLIDTFKLVQDYLISHALYENSLAFNLNYFQTLLEYVDKKNKETVEVEPPDELLDPIMQTLIETPVILPNTDIIVDKDVISRHLLTDNYNPFNRETLTIETLEEYNTKDEIVIKIKEFKEKVHEWKESLTK